MKMGGKNNGKDAESLLRTERWMAEWYSRCRNGHSVAVFPWTQSYNLACFHLRCSSDGTARHRPELGGTPADNTEVYLRTLFYLILSPYFSLTVIWSRVKEQNSRTNGEEDVNVLEEFWMRTSLGPAFWLFKNVDTNKMKGNNWTVENRFN